MVVIGLEVCFGKIRRCVVESEVGIFGRMGAAELNIVRVR